uniref:Uncharacterized protein n=1 Tax=Spodoptera littoralis nuclear polyhedrosis virus TaxID=10456 RepID=A0A3G4S8T9_NPVSL|nr:hypothetical protein [Spodoptera littoralis nucleopolyhedrovirus]
MTIKMINNACQKFVTVVAEEFKKLNIEEKYPFSANEQFDFDMVFNMKDLYYPYDVTLDGKMVEYDSDTTGFDFDNSHILNMPIFQYLVRNVLNVHLGTRYFVKYNGKLYYIFINENNQIQYKILDFFETEYFTPKLALFEVNWNYTKHLANEYDNVFEFVQVIKEIVNDDDDNFQLLMTKCINYEAKFDDLNVYMSNMTI